MSSDRKAEAITFSASAAVTAGTSYSSGFLVDSYTEAIIFINVTAITAGSLDITIEISPDNTTYYTDAALTQMTTISTQLKRVTNFGSYMRLKYVVTTGPATFSAVGTFKT